MDTLSVQILRTAHIQHDFDTGFRNNPATLKFIVFEAARITVKRHHNHFFVKRNFGNHQTSYPLK